MMSKKQYYTIRVESQVSMDWSPWLDSYTIEHMENETIIHCELVDQTALYGVLMLIRDLGLTLIEVKRLENSNDQI